MWISCDGKNCGKWNHPDCEIEYGEDENMKFAASKLKQAQEEEALEEENKMLDQTGRSQNSSKDNSASNDKGRLESSSKKEPEEPEPTYYCLKCRK
jgi:hypothetical protein